MAGRLVQGALAAAVGLGPTAVSLVFPPERRGRALGLVGAAIGVGGGVGAPPRRRGDRPRRLVVALCRGDPLRRPGPPRPEAAAGRHLTGRPAVSGPAWVTGALVALVAAGTTLAKIASTGVSLSVPEENLPSGISVNEMVWISGTGVGTTLFSAVAARSGASGAINPLHSGPGVGYSEPISPWPSCCSRSPSRCGGRAANRAGSAEKGCAAGDRGNI